LFTTTGAGVVELPSDGMLISEGRLMTVLGEPCAAVASTFASFFMPNTTAKAAMPMASSASTPAATFKPWPEFWAMGMGA
jgi:hypothetical protein